MAKSNGVFLNRTILIPKGKLYFDESKLVKYGNKKSNTITAIVRGGSLSRSGSVTESVSLSVCQLLAKLEKEFSKGSISESRKL